MSRRTFKLFKVALSPHLKLCVLRLAPIQRPWRPRRTGKRMVLGVVPAALQFSPRHCPHARLSALLVHPQGRLAVEPPIHAPPQAPPAPLQAELAPLSSIPVLAEALLVPPRAMRTGLLLRAVLLSRRHSPPVRRAALLAPLQAPVAGLSAIRAPTLAPLALPQSQSTSPPQAHLTAACVRPSLPRGSALTLVGRLHLERPWTQSSSTSTSLTVVPPFMLVPPTSSCPLHQATRALEDSGRRKSRTSSSPRLAAMMQLSGLMARNQTKKTRPHRCPRRPFELKLWRHVEVSFPPLPSSARPFFSPSCRERPTGRRTRCD